MKHHDDSYLSDLLKKMDDDTTWSRKRQQNIRRNILSAIDEETSKTRGVIYWMRRTAAPVLTVLLVAGVSVTLYLSGFSDQSPLSSEQGNNVTQTPDDSGNKTQHDTSSLYINDQNEAAIQEIKASGFDLRLPSYSPFNPMEVVSVVKRPAGSGSHVSVTFNHEGEEKFELWQESFTSDHQARVNQRLNQIKEEATEQVNIDGNLAYITNTNKAETLYLITENYGFVVHSFDLSTDQLIEVAESIDLSNLH